MKTENENQIGKRMKELRGLMSQRQAASCVGIKPQSWSVYENGQSLPGAQVIKNICQHFNVSADWLLGCDAVREVPREVFPIQPPVRSPKAGPTHDASPDSSLLAELAMLKRRVKALEDAAANTTACCG